MSPLFNQDSLYNNSVPSGILHKHTKNLGIEVFFPLLRARFGRMSSRETISIGRKIGH